MAKLKDGFYKLTAEAIGSNTHVLLAGGGSKALSDFATSSEVSNSLKLYVTLDTALTITGAKTFDNTVLIRKEHTDKNYYGIRLLGSGDIGYLLLGQITGDKPAHKGAITGINNTNLTSLEVKSLNTNFLGDLTMSGNLSISLYNNLIKSRTKYSIKVLNNNISSTASLCILLLHPDTTTTTDLLSPGYAVDGEITLYRRYGACISNIKITSCAGHSSSWNKAVLEINSETIYSNFKLVTCTYKNTTYRAISFYASQDIELSQFRGFHNTDSNFGKIIVTVDKDGNYNTNSGVTNILDYSSDGIKVKYIIASHLKINGNSVIHTGNYSSYLGYIGTTAVQASSAVQNLTGIENINMAGDILIASNGDTGIRLIRLTGGSNDFGRIAVGATASNAGWMEIATADDATEPIYVRLYKGTYATLTRTLTLLDADGNTTIPNNLSVNGYLNLAGNKYHYKDKCGINMNNSDIIGVNSIVTLDLAESGNEGIKFYRDATHVDSLWAQNGNLYFNQNMEVTSDGCINGTNRTVIHSGNIGSLSVNYATSAGYANTAGSANSVAWGNITGKPSSYTPSDHDHNYAPIGPVVFTPANIELTSADVLAKTGEWSIRKGTWSYANNGYIKAGDFGNIDLAGTSIITIGDSIAYTQLYITAPTQSGHSGKTNEMFFYNDHGNDYKPGWTRVLTNRNYTDYTVTKTGSGASGTWGINITGSATNSDTLNGLHSSAFKKTWEVSAGGSYTGWITIAKWTISDEKKAGNFTSHPFMLSIRRAYNSPAPESYTFSLTFGWDTATITQISGNAKNRIIENIRIAKSSNSLTYNLEIYVNTSYETYQNTCYCVAYGYYGDSFSGTTCNEKSSGMTTVLAQLTTASNAMVGNLVDSLKKVTVPNNTNNDFNTFKSMTLTGRGDPTTGASLSNAPWTGAGPAGGYGVLTYLWSTYGTLMAWGYNSNRIYIRPKYYANSTATWSSTWDSLALTSDLKNPTDYYWADVQVSASSSEETTPTFKSITTTHNSYVATLRPSKTETHFLGNVNYRWNGVFSKSGNFSGQITSSVTDKAPFIISSAIKNTNLNADMVDGKHASDFKQVNVSNVSYTPNLTKYGGGSINNTYYYKVAISNVNNIWTMLYLEMDIKENYINSNFGKLIIHLNKNKKNEFSGVYALIFGTLSNSIKVYVANGTTLDIYIAGNWNYSTIDVSRLNFGDASTDVAKSITLDTITTLPSTYATANIIRSVISDDLANYMKATKVGDYYGLTTPEGSSSAYIRTTSNGLLPYLSGGITNGHCSIGTSAWYFNLAYITKVNCNTVESSAVLYINGKNSIQLKTDTNESAVILNTTLFKPFNTANDKLTLGSDTARWSNTYSVLGNFSGQITSLVAEETAPFIINSTTVNEKLNADMVDGYNIWTGTQTLYNSATKNNNTIYLIY